MGKQEVGDRITVALVQSLYKCASEVSQRIGCLVADECHRCPSRTFTEAVSAFDASTCLDCLQRHGGATGFHDSSGGTWGQGSRRPRQDLVEHGQILWPMWFSETRHSAPTWTQRTVQQSALAPHSGSSRNALIAQDVAREH